MANSPWEELFPPLDAPGLVPTIRMREVRKEGRPLLLLSPDARAAQAGISLYAAQTKFASLAKHILRLLFRFRFTPLFPEVTLTLSPADSFVRFLCTLLGESGAARFSVLAGNPAAEGRRFILVVLPREPAPPVVVKTGVTASARDLVKKELAVLRWAAAGGVKGIPALVGEHEDARTTALAMRFIEGESPPPCNPPELGQLLSSWIGPEGVRVTLDDAWQALAECSREHPAWQSLESKFSQIQLAATLQHGDFAPWNVKVDRASTWHVLDWERGKVAGLPGWDWYHYVTQSAILVRRLETGALLQVIEQMLRSQGFQDYAGRAGLHGHEREWFQAYLLYVVFVLKPTEGLVDNRELLKAFRP